MSDRIKLLLQKRTSLKSQITGLSNILDKDRIDKTSLKLRMKRLTDLYHTFEENNDELAVLDSNENHQAEFANIQDRYYALAARIENVLQPEEIAETSTNRSTLEVSINDTDRVTSTKNRRIKLPETSLPTFDGKYENWLSFKNAFNNMIGLQSDLSDVDKLHYLKSALTGEAINKIRILSIDGTNYTTAWQLLERAYEVKRILISRHLSLILNLPTIERDSADGLSKLADDAQQHVAALKALGVSVGSEIMVHIIESKLPKGILERWETTLERDSFPDIDEMYEFLYKSAVCASKRERSKGSETEKTKSEPLAKRKRYIASNQAFTLYASRSCIMCKNTRHPLYKCAKFKELPVRKRIETITNAKLCYNCLRSHRGETCKFSTCTICHKRHNTLLHVENYTTPKESSITKNASIQTK